MKDGLWSTSIAKVLDWARSNSLWYVSTGAGCCADEALQTFGCRYDLERFGSILKTDPAQADLLIVSGLVTQKSKEALKALYDRMIAPKYVMALGSRANCGGAFARSGAYCVVAGVDQVVPVDVYVPGCPPRPEAIMNGIIKLQEKIQGNAIERQRPRFEA